MRPVPVHVVSGTERALARALMARCAAARPDWRVLELLSCPCCTGRVELQVRLVKLLREERPARVLIGLVDPSHRAALERMLAGWPFSNHVVPGRALSVPQDTSLTPEALEAS